MANEIEKRSEDFSGFIKILYGVVLGRGLFDLAANLGLPTNFKNFASPGFVLFAGALFFIIRDWNTYFSSLRKRPHTDVWRFVVDLLILICFFFLVRVATSDPQLSEEQIRAYSVTAAVYFLLLALWELLAAREYQADPTQSGLAKYELCWDLAFFSLFGIGALLNWNNPSAEHVAAFLALFATLSIFVKEDFAPN